MCASELLYLVRATPEYVSLWIRQAGLGRRYATSRNVLALLSGFLLTSINHEIPAAMVKPARFYRGRFSRIDGFFIGVERAVLAHAVDEKIRTFTRRNV